MLFGLGSLKTARTVLSRSKKVSLLFLAVFVCPLPSATNLWSFVLTALVASSSPVPFLTLFRAECLTGFQLSPTRPWRDALKLPILLFNSLVSRLNDLFILHTNFVQIHRQIVFPPPHPTKDTVDDAIMLIINVKNDTAPLTLGVNESYTMTVGSSKHNSAIEATYWLFSVCYQRWDRLGSTSCPRDLLSALPMERHDLRYPKYASYHHRYSEVPLERFADECGLLLMPRRLYDRYGSPLLSSSRDQRYNRLIGYEQDECPSLAHGWRWGTSLALSILNCSPSRLRSNLALIFKTKEPGSLLRSTAKPIWQRLSTTDKWEASESYVWILWRYLSSPGTWSRYTWT